MTHSASTYAHRRRFSGWHLVGTLAAVAAALFAWFVVDLVRDQQNYAAIEDFGFSYSMTYRDFSFHRDLGKSSLGDEDVDEAIRLFGQIRRIEYLNLTEARLTPRGFERLIRGVKCREIKVKAAGFDDDSAAACRDQLTLQRVGVDGPFASTEWCSARGG